MNSRSVALGLVLCVVSGTAAQPAATALDQARALQQKGDLEAAEAAYRALIPRLRKSSENRPLAEALMGLATVEIGSGDYGKAIGTSTEAVAICRKLADRSCEARATNQVGVGQFHLGDWETALGNFSRSLDLFRQVGDTRYVILRHSNLGTVYSLQGRYQDALREYQSGLELLKGNERQDWHARVRQLILTNIATLYQRLGQNRKALELYRDLGQDALDPSEQARMLVNLGTAYRRLGDPVKALEYYGRARQLPLPSLKYDIEIGILKCAGIAQALDFDDLETAMNSFTRALALAEQSSSRPEEAQARLYLAEALLRLRRLEEARRQYQAALTIAAEIAAGEDEWKARCGLGRIASAEGRTAEARAHYEAAIAKIESLRSGLESSALRSEFLASKRDVYDALMALLLAEPRPDPEVIFNLLERARARLFQDDLRRRAESLLSSTHRSDIARLRELRSRIAYLSARPQRALPEERPALLMQLGNLEREYQAVERRLEEALPDGAYRRASLASVQARLDPETALLLLWDGPDTAGVLWVTHDRTGLSAAPVAHADLLRLLAAVSQPGGDWRTLAADLGAALFAGVPPLADPRTRHLIIVPDGDLQWLPFEALGRPMLIERFDVSYAPAAGMLLRPAPRRALAPPWRKQLLAFADPVVSEYLPGDERWQRLPKSGDEVRAIAAALPGRAEVYTGPAATKRVLVSGRGRGVPVLHLSTHAAVDAEDSGRSRILFSPAAGKGNDYLFLSEVPALDLTGVDLVTISACETELGRLVRSEGVQSFSRAFLLAGARSTVTTLWRVADEPTAEFMRLFYHRLARGASKAEALRDTKLRFLRSGTALAHPSYWAAFVLNGDGLAPVPPQLSWATVFGMAGAALLLAGVVVRVKTR